MLDYLKDRHKIEIQLDRKALSDVGIGSDTPVTRNLQGVSLKSALRLMLRDMELTYIIKDGVVLITTPERAESELETRIYPVGDLVLPSGSTDGSQADFDSLIDLITSTIKPTSWDEVGGPGSIKPFANNMTITLSQTAEVHEEIEELLERLRQVSRETGGADCRCSAHRAILATADRTTAAASRACSAARVAVWAAWVAAWAGPIRLALRRTPEPRPHSPSRQTSSKASSRRTRAIKANSLEN